MNITKDLVLEANSEGDGASRLCGARLGERAYHERSEGCNSRQRAVKNGTLDDAHLASLHGCDFAQNRHNAVFDVIFMTMCNAQRSK